jgi:23S rRNA pseudouridine1911/1915/1917 synthase
MEPVILHEDNQMLVIDKPAGMVVNNSATNHGQTVQNWFLEKNPDINNHLDSEFGQKGGVVHRLDKETSGIMLLAKTSEAYELLKKQFVERKVKKEYQALVHGIFKEKEGIISEPITRNPKSFGRFVVGGDLSRTAVTEWKIESEYSSPEKLSLVRLTPMTGRTHQLRVHLKHMGHPIVGDDLYVGRRILVSDREWCPRMFLHACQIRFFDPETGREAEYRTELPKVLEEVRQKLVH